VTLLEKTSRTGGRAYTYKGNDWYGDLGAMRFPPKKEMPLMWEMFGLFNLTKKLKSFTNLNEGSSSYYYLNNTYFSYNKDIRNNNQQKLEEFYKIFDVKTNVKAGTFPRAKNGSLINPSYTSINASFPLKFPTDPLKLCLNDKSLKDVYENTFRKAKLPATELINIWSLTEMVGAFLPYSAYQAFFDIQTKNTTMNTTIRTGKKQDEFATMYEIEGGVSVLPETILKKIESKVNLIKEASVKHIKVDETKVNVETEKGIEKRTFDKVVITATAPATSKISFSPNLPQEKQNALKSFNYLNAVKVFFSIQNSFLGKT